MGFKFQDNIIRLEFETRTFEVSPIETARIMSRITGKANETDRKVISGEMDIDSAIREIVCDIDDILGAGGCAEIFHGRTVRYEDLADVVAYIGEELGKYFKRKKYAYKNNKGKKHV